MVVFPIESTFQACIKSNFSASPEYRVGTMTNHSQQFAPYVKLRILTLGFQGLWLSIYMILRMSDILVTDLSHHEVSDYGTVSKLMSIGNTHR